MRPGTSAPARAALRATPGAVDVGGKGQPVMRRPYLRADERRAQLLEAAATIAGREGLGGLTMAGVAGAAGVSRQWVHEHFGDVSGLCRAVVLDRFAALDDEITRAFRTGAKPRELLRFVARRVLELPVSDRRILSTLLTGGGAVPGLVAVEEEFRERLIRRWLAILRPADPLDPVARARVWALVSATFGLADNVARGEIGIDGALEVLGELSQRIAGAMTRTSAEVPSLAGGAEWSRRWSPPRAPC